MHLRDLRITRVIPPIEKWEVTIAAHYDYEIWKMDVKTTFLNGNLSEEVYMTQPEGFIS